MNEPTTVVSIVVPARDEAGNLPRLHQEIRAVFDALPNTSYQLVLVNDGSTDATGEVIDALCAADPAVLGIHLSRNFGHQSALLAGIDHAEGDCVITMDADLEQPPSAIPALLAAWQEGFDVVHAVRRDHPDIGWFKKWTSRAFYRVFSFLSQVPMEPGMLDFRLLDRKVLTALREFTEADFFFRGIATWVGFRQTRVPYCSGIRTWGRTKYDLRRMVRLAMAGITSFSTFPLRIATWMGMALTGLSVTYGAWVIVRHFGWQHPNPGYTSIVALITFLMGVQFLLIGLLGEYVARIHVEVKRRPRYVVARRTGGASSASARPARLSSVRP